MKQSFICFCILAILVACDSSPEDNYNIYGEEVEYSTLHMSFNGYISYDRSQNRKRPGILIVHEWWGHNEYIRNQADRLADLGYTAFAIDMFGNGKQADNSDEAAKLAKEVSENPELRTSRFIVAMDFLRNHETVDPDSVAAIGYSFGGNVVLQMAFEGVDLKGVISVYGGLLITPPSDSENVKARILILHGEKDWYVTPQMLTRFKIGMEKSGINYGMISYKEAQHGFTNPEAKALAEKYKGMHIEYNKEADKKSWNDIQEFLKAVFHNQS